MNPNLGAQQNWNSQPENTAHYQDDNPWPSGINPYANYNPETPSGPTQNTNPAPASENSDYSSYYYQCYWYYWAQYQAQANNQQNRPTQQFPHQPPHHPKQPQPSQPTQIQFQNQAAQLKASPQVHKFSIQPQRVNPINHNNKFNQMTQQPLKTSGNQGQGNQQKPYPPELHEYIGRAVQGLNEEQKAEVTEELRSMLNKVQSKGPLDKIDWTREPLPQSSLKYQQQALASKFQQVKATKKKEQKQTKQSKKQKSFENASFFASNPALMEDRQKRFQAFSSSLQNAYNQSRLVEEEPEAAVVGTCQVLEKSYLRLTAKPDPALVRPEKILKEALNMVKRKWIETQDWEWTTDQIKSIRQDLTVQNIKNEFTVKVYELHARLCLENGNLGEFNTCQAQLKVLYSLEIKGCVQEFTAYRILYSLYEENEMSINLLLQELQQTPELLQAKEIVHAMQARKALASRNFVLLFRLAETVPNMGLYLLDFVFQKARLTAMHYFVRAYRPTLPVIYVKNTLKFETLQACHQWLEDHFVTLISNKQIIDCKEATLGLIRWEKEWEEKHALSKESRTES